MRTPQVRCTGFPKPGNTPTEWLLTKICSISLLKVMFPNLVKLSAVAQSLSVTNAWPEWGPSDLKWIKTRLRNSLKDDIVVVTNFHQWAPVSKAKDVIEQAVRLSCQLCTWNNQFYNYTIKLLVMVSSQVANGSTCQHQLADV